MKITKLGHCCLVIESGIKILTDPGAYSSKQNDIKDVDVILITHEHPDHLHVESLEKVLENNPEAEVITNAAVGKILDKEGIKYTIVSHGQSVTREGVKIEGFGTEHAYIYKTVGSVENTGYFIGDKLFYPGDAFYDPDRPVDILALPVAGPWMRISEAIEYALKLKPRVAFPVHDGMLVSERLGPAHRLPLAVLSAAGIKFVAMTEGSSEEL
jgi:L-ascorbate metabolism protein UlaG (beta-lactamase superfamily)